MIYQSFFAHLPSAVELVDVNSDGIYDIYVVQVDDETEGSYCKEPFIKDNWRSNNGRALLNAARLGLGLVQLPSFYLEADLADGKLVTVLDPYNPTDTGIWAVYPHNRHLSAKVRLFVNFLAERFQQ